MKTRAELIQDYIDKVLSAEDERVFQTLWESDADFREEVAFQQDLQETLRKRLDGKEEALRQSLLSAERGMRSGGKIKVWRKWIIPIAAAACLLILGRLFLFPPAYYQLPDMRSEIVRGDRGSEKRAYEDAVKAFNRKDYRHSTTLLQGLLREEPTILQYQYYLGLSLIGETKFEEAKQHLLPLADGQSVFRHEANYYLAVAFVETGQKEEAKQRLALIEPASKIYAKAQKLLRKLQ